MNGDISKPAFQPSSLSSISQGKKPHHFRSKKIEKYYGMFRSLSISQQIFYFFWFLLVIYTTLLLYLKLNQLSELLKAHINKNYYSSIVINKLNEQRQIKATLDNINSIHTQNIYDRQLLFLQIYSKEMISNNIAGSPQKIFNIEQLDQEKSKTFYSSISPLFTMTKGLTDLMKVSQQEQSDNNNYSNLLFLFYNNVPLFYQNLNSINKISLMSYSLLSYDMQCNENNQVYFRFPLEQVTFDTGVIQQNDRYYDRIIDPVNRCENENDIINNWYYQYHGASIDDGQIRIISLNKENFVHENEEYFMNFLSFKINNGNNVISFIQKINKNYSHSNPKNQNFDELFSVISKINDYSIHIDKKNNNYYNNNQYSIDDNEHIILRSPSFIQDFYSYAIFPKDKDPKSELNIFSLSYEEMKNIVNYDINYYFSKDVMLFSFIDFINTYFYSNKCLVTNLTEYYNTVDYKCEVDYCFYHKCNITNSLFDQTFNPWDYGYLPNCYCLPLFCIDERNKDTIPLEFSKIESFTELIKDVGTNGKIISTNENYFSFINKEAKCRINLNQKNSTNSPTKYLANIKYSDTMSDSRRKSLNIHLFDDSKITKEVINPFSQLIYAFMWKVYLIYSIGVGALLISVVLLLWIKVNNLKKRILEIRKILPKIIEYSNYKKKNLLKEDFANKSNSRNLSNYYSNDDALSLIESTSSTKDLPLLSSLINNEISNKNEEKKKELSQKSNSFHKTFGLVKKGDKYEPVLQDELQDLNYLVYTHINEFKLSFSVDEHMFGEDKIINDIYNMLITDRNRNSIGRVNLSMSILNELISCEGFVDLNTLRPNFYYKDDINNSLLQKINEVDMKGDGVNFINEVTDGDKIKNVIDYYIYVIQKPLKEEYDNNNNKL